MITKKYTLTWNPDTGKQRVIEADDVATVERNYETAKLIGVWPLDGESHSGLLVLGTNSGKILAAHRIEESNEVRA